MNKQNMNAVIIGAGSTVLTQLSRKTSKPSSRFSIVRVGDRRACIRAASKGRRIPWPTSLVAKSDYAANGGSIGFNIARATLPNVLG